MEKIASRNSFTEIYELVARLMFFAVVTVSLFLTSNLCKIYFHWPNGSVGQRIRTLLSLARTTQFGDFEV